MSVDYDHVPSEFEELSESLSRDIDDKISYLEKRLNDIEETVYVSHKETALGIEGVKKQLNAPFTKGEGFTLFFGGIGGNVLVAGFLDVNTSYNIVTYVGTAMVTLSLIVWIYLFRRKS